MYRLELKYQNLTVKEYRLQDGDIRFIGRAPENHIVKLRLHAASLS